MERRDPRSQHDNDEFWKTAMEAVETGLKLKKIMRDKKITRCKAECPRCGNTIHASLAGPKNHLRMACEGHCGMNVME